MNDHRFLRGVVIEDTDLQQSTGLIRTDRDGDALALVERTDPVAGSVLHGLLGDPVLACAVRDL